MKRSFSTFTAVLTLLAALFAGSAWAQDDDNPVVLRVGDEERTLEEFDRRFEIAVRGVAARQGMPMNEQTRAQLEALAPQFLQQRVRELVLLQEAEARDISLSEEEVDELVAEVRGDSADAEFEQVLQQSGIQTTETLRTLLAEGELIGRVQQSIADDVEVSDEEVRQTYEEDPEAFATEAEACARHILVESEEDANTILDELASGTSFADAASEWGTDGTAEQGGELGCITRGQTVPAFEEAIFAEDVTLGEPFGPVETQFGFHVIQVDERNEAETPPLEEVRSDIESQLQSQGVQARVSELVEAANVETFEDRLPYEAPQAPQPAPQAPAPEQPEGEQPEGDGEN